MELFPHPLALFLGTLTTLSSWIADFPCASKVYDYWFFKNINFLIVIFLTELRLFQFVVLQNTLYCEYTQKFIGFCLACAWKITSFIISALLLFSERKDLFLALVHFIVATKQYRFTEDDRKLFGFSFWRRMEYMISGTGLMIELGK